VWLVLWCARDCRLSQDSRRRSPRGSQLRRRSDEIRPQLLWRWAQGAAADVFRRPRDQHRGDRQFLHNCFEKQPSQDDFETMLAFNMMVPPKVRANMAGRTLNIDNILAALKLPVLVTQGATDRLALPAAAKYAAAKISSAKLSLYDGIGHAPFWERIRRASMPNSPPSCGQPTRPIDARLLSRSERSGAAPAPAVS
jgi:pimeloyl-ACP methyl ester carboxylesterase